MHDRKHPMRKLLSDVVKKIAEDVTKAGYSISTGYSIRSHKDNINDVVRESDKLMYQDKAGYYHSKGQWEHKSKINIVASRNNRIRENE